MIREYVVERSIMPIEEVIYKMTALPAQRISLEDRGVLKAGMAADINVFALDAIRDKATFADSKQLAEGISYTLIGGEIAAKDSRLVKDGSGRVLRAR